MATTKRRNANQLLVVDVLTADLNRKHNPREVSLFVYLFTFSAGMNSSGAAGAAELNRADRAPDPAGALGNRLPETWPTS